LQVELGGPAAGRVALCDVHDVMVDNVLTNLKLGQCVKGRVVEVKEEVTASGEGFCMPLSRHGWI
jgi:predicted RNA-binding protein with RPS1 domain